jgi:hypothetical protein
MDYRFSAGITEGDPIMPAGVMAKVMDDWIQHELWDERIEGGESFIGSPVSCLLTQVVAKIQTMRNILVSHGGAFTAAATGAGYLSVRELIYGADTGYVLASTPEVSVPGMVWERIN